MTVRVAQISDSHLSPSKPFFQGNFERVVAHLHDDRPDLVINTGDLSLDGADLDADLEHAQAAHAKLSIETHVLPGNHDVGDHVDVARRQPVNAERLDRYRRIIGADAWAIDLPGWRLLGLNALTLGTEAVDDGAQMELIRDGLATLDGRALAIFLHKPLMDETYEEALVNSRFTTPGPRAALLAALGSVIPAVMACGHVHQYRDTTVAGTRHVWAPATSFLISDPWQPGYGCKTIGYVEHEFDADGAHRHRLRGVRGIEHHDLAEIPDAYGDVRKWGVGGA